MNPQHWNINAKQLIRLGMFGFAALLSVGILSYAFSLSVLTTVLLSFALATSVELCYQGFLTPRVRRIESSDEVLERMDAALNVRNIVHTVYHHELTPAIIRQRFVARVLAKEGLPDSVIAKMHRFTSQEFDVFERAFDNLINLEDLTQEQQEMIHQLKPSEELINGFIQECQRKFGVRRISGALQQIPYLDNDVVHTYEALIRRWSQDPDYIMQFSIETKAAIDQYHEQIEVDEFPNKPSVVHQFNRQQQSTARDEPANDEAMNDNKELRNRV